MRKWTILLLTLTLSAALDQAAKGWALTHLQPYEAVQPIEALAPVFQLTLISNSGAAFGILPMAGEVFLVVALVIVVGLLFSLRKLPAQARLMPFAIGLVTGGAIGNALDRLQHGHVIDFIHYQIPNLISNVSNLADHAIVLGVLLILADSLLRRRD